jgi:hypothetical protein
VSGQGAQLRAAKMQQSNPWFRHRSVDPSKGRPGSRYVSCGPPPMLGSARRSYWQSPATLKTFGLSATIVTPIPFM